MSRDETNSCSNCSDCAVFASHVLQATGRSTIRVQLHQQGGMMHMLVRHSRQTEAGSSDVLNNIKIMLAPCSTEWATEFHASFLKAMGGCAFVKEGLTQQLSESTTRRFLVGKKDMAAQALPIEVLSRYFHLPINDASKALGICPTSLKKVCRKHGLPRWPHRKVKSMENKLAKSHTRLQASSKGTFQVGGLTGLPTMAAMPTHGADGAETLRSPSPSPTTMAMQSPFYTPTKATMDTGVASTPSHPPAATMVGKEAPPLCAPVMKTEPAHFSTHAAGDDAITLDALSSHWIANIDFTVDTDSFIDSLFAPA